MDRIEKDNSIKEAQMKIDLTRAVKSYKKANNIQDAINEAIVNSLQANSTKIDINVSANNDLYDKAIISKITITDNGDGFTDTNSKAFLELYTANKELKGCQGIGRLSYLKIFKNIHINSKQHNKHVEFDFTTKLTDSDLQAKDITENTKETILTLENPNKEEFFDIDKFYNDTFEHIYPFLFLNENDCVITINQDKQISKNDVKNIEHTDFTINEIKFDLWYRFEISDKTKLDDFICIHKRPSKHFYHKPLSLSIYQPDGYRTTFFLESEWLNAQSNEYHDIEYEEGQEERFDNVEWCDVKKQLTIKINQLLSNKFENYKLDKEKHIQLIKEKYLYLSDYIEDEIGFITEKDLIEKARKKLAKEDDKLMQMRNNNETDNVEFLKQAKKVVSHDLIKYVLHRQNIIDSLVKLKDTNIENEIHKLVLQKGNEGDDLSPVPLQDNNLWLLDDKFMSYNYVCSNKKIATLLKKINQDGQSENIPDISIYTIDKNVKKIIFIELKKFTADKYQNTHGIDQLNIYAKDIKESGIDEIYLYLIINIDNDTKTLLEGRHFVKIYSKEGDIWQGKIGGVNAYIQIISPDAIISDADTRNKTFLNFIKNSIQSS